MTGWTVYWSLRRRGVELAVRDGKLRATRGALTPEVKDAFRPVKNDLISLITAAIVADRYLVALRAEAHLPPLTRVSRTEAERVVATWEANRADKTSQTTGGGP